MSNTEPSLTEQQQIRLEKLDEQRELGINPFPNSYDVTHYSEEIHSDESLLVDDTRKQENASRVRVAGRIMTRRIMGKAAFFNLRNARVTIKVSFRRVDIGEMLNIRFFRNMVGMGDFVGFGGLVFKTGTGGTPFKAEE